MFEIYFIGIYVLIMFVITILNNLFLKKSIETSTGKEYFSVNKRGIKIGDKKVFIKINTKTYIRTSILYFSVFFLNEYFIKAFGFDSIQFNSILNLLSSIFIAIFSIYMDFIITDINITTEEVVEMIKTERKNLEIEETKEEQNRKKEFNKNGIMEEIVILKILMDILAGIILSLLFQ